MNRILNKTKANQWRKALTGLALLLPFSATAYGSSSLLIDGTAAYTNSTSSGGAGLFTSDDNQIVWQFQVVGPTVFTAYTTSFAAGGFAPNLTLFFDDLTPGDPTGLFIAQGSEGESNIPNGCGPTQAIDPATVNPSNQSGYCFDSYLQQTLDTGNYLLVLTEDPSVLWNGDTYNSGTGFLYAPGSGDLADPHFTATLYAANESQPDFWLFDNTPRTGNFAVSGTLDPIVSGVPEPSTLLLLGSALVACVGLHRLKRTA